MQTFTLPAPSIFATLENRHGGSLARARTTFLMFDTPATFGDAAQTVTRNRFSLAQTCRSGDLSLVAPSDAFLAKMEQFAIPTARRQLTDDVCGAVPNVPAFIAGHPLAMRRRHRVENDGAPIAIIVDLTSSGAVPSGDLLKRGAVILALVRSLAGRRPVELWACAGLNIGTTRAAFVVVRIETAPIDLSVAAFVLSDPRVSRSLMYGVLQEAQETKCGGAWPYKLRGPLTREQMEAVFAPAMSHVTETLCLPGLHMDDQSVRSPEAWLVRQIAEHGAVDLAA